MLHPDAQALRDAVYLAFESGIVEGDELAASLADQVVMVLSAGVDRLEAGLSRPDDHALDQPVLDEQLEHPIDARAAHRGSLGAQLVLDLHGAERARLAGQQLDDPLARAPALVPCAGQHSMHVLTPCRCFGLGHSVLD